MSKKITDENGNVQKKPFYKKAWFWIVVVIIIAAGSSAQGGSSESGKSNGGDAKKAQQDNVVKTTPEEIVANYTQKTSSQADAIYKGKTTQVTGKVLDVKDGVLGGHDVTIDAGTVDGNEFEKQSLSFNFKESNKDEALSIQPGSTITVQGKFSNAMIMGGDDGDPKWVSSVSFTKSSLVK